MRTPTRFRAETKYTESTAKKANTNLPIMATVGDHLTGAAAVTGRPGWYHIRLGGETVANPNPTVASRLTQCKSEGVALVLNDYIYVIKARDRNLTYYEFHSFIQTAGGLPVPPVCPKWEQVFTVSVNSCQYRLVSDAVVAINALVALGTAPTAASPWLIQVMAGDYTETADVTIRQYVHVKGRGESTVLDMGANTLFLDSDTSLESLVVESSDPVAAIGVIAEDNVMMRDVRCIQTAVAGTPDCFYLNANTNVYLYNCIAEVAQNGAGYHVVNDDAIMYLCTALADTYSATTYGFQVSGVASVELHYCVADDDTNFGDGLHLDAAGLTCTTRWCTFAGADDDVNTGATSTWQHFMCQFDPDNSTIGGTEIPLVTGQANFDDVVTFENGITFDGLTTQNIITIPDIVADALEVVDSITGDEYLGFRTAAQKEVVINEDGADIDFRVEAVGPIDALFVQGSDGAIIVAGPSMTVPDGWILGIGPALERLVFNAAGDISVMGARFGVGTLTPGTDQEIVGTTATLRVAGSTSATLWLSDTGAPANQKYALLRTVGGLTTIRALNDALDAYTYDFLAMDHSTGHVGVGMISPLGRLHGFDTHGGFMYWEGDVDGAGEVVIIPDGAGDVERAAYFTQITWANAAADYGCTHSCIINPGDGPSTSDLYADGVPNRLQLQLKANGELVLLRTQGADTYDVVMWIIWQ